MNTQQSNTIKVWDLVVRVGHWTLVTCFFVAWFTEDDFLTVHVWAGYVLAVVVLFRLLWGFIGSPHARFKDFLYTPARVLAYLKSLRSDSPGHFLGHNPAGGVMILLLLACLSATVYTGLELYAVEEGAGPLAQLDQAPIPQLVATARADSDQPQAEDSEDAEEFWEELHEFFANLTLLMILIHVGGVAISSYLHDENLVKAMVTGKKRA